MGQQGTDVACRARRQVRQHVSKVDPRLMPVEAGLLHQAHHGHAVAAHRSIVPIEALGLHRGSRQQSLWRQHPRGYCRM